MMMPCKVLYCTCYHKKPTNALKFLSSDNLLKACQNYFKRFGAKPTCATDLKYFICELDRKRQRQLVDETFKVIKFVDGDKPEKVKKSKKIKLSTDYDPFSSTDFWYPPACQLVSALPLPGVSATLTKRKSTWAYSSLRESFPKEPGAGEKLSRHGSEAQWRLYYHSSLYSMVSLDRLRQWRILLESSCAPRICLEP